MNHDDEYHGDINYGNAFPEDWYWMKELDDDPDAEEEFSDFMGESDA